MEKLFFTLVDIHASVLQPPYDLLVELTYYFGGERVP